MNETVEKKALAPKLRFPQFQGKSAAVVQLSKLAEPVTGGAPNGDPAPVLTLSAEHGIVSQDTYFGKRVAGENTDRYTFIERGDFVYNDRITSQSRYGTIRRLHESANGIVSPIYKCFRFPDEADASFFDYYLQSGKHDSEIRSLINEGARSGRYNLTITQFLSTRVPKFLSAEQRKIAECLQSLDELIAAQTEKLEALKRHKKGLLQQLFPAEGETTPRLRFPGSSLRWNVTALNPMIQDLRSGKSKAVASGAWDLYGSTGIIGKTDDAAYSGEHLLIARVGANAGQVAYINGPTFGATDNTLVLRLNKAASAKFLYFYLQKVDLNSMVFGSGQPLITGTQLKGLELSVPLLDEQEKIADALTAIDSETECLTSAVLLLRTHKAGLMQKLFPDVEEFDK